MNNVNALIIDAGDAIRSHQTVNTGRLEKVNFTQVATLADGVAAMRKSSFQIVLVSLSLPGVCVADSIPKAKKMAKSLPVIVLANVGEDNRVAEALSLGADDYVTKGCQCDLLVRTMRYAIERRNLIADRDQARQGPSNTDAQMTAHLSHELRNSLACIHQFGTIMLDGLAGTISEEQREYLCIMLENASTMRRVLDNVLESRHVPQVENTNESNHSY